MAQAVITKAQQQELAAVMVPLLRKQLTADVLKAAKLSPTAPKTRAKSTTTSRDIPTELLDRMLRVEEELKHLRADTNQLRKDFIVQIDRMDKRFDKVDERFMHMENTFNERFIHMESTSNERFVHIEKTFNERFEQMGKTFNERFEQAERSSDKKFSSQRWFIGIIFVAISTLITVYQFLN